MQLRGANEDLLSENRSLKDKVGTLNREIDTLVRQSSAGPSTSILDALEREKSRLRADLSDRERQIDQLRAQLDYRDGSAN
jgi:predicted RNase H-like nuclease (RuvC/YqgF family)